MDEAPAPPAADARTAQALHRFLETSGFDGARVRELLGSPSGLLVREGTLPLARQRIAADETAFGALVALLVLGDPVVDAESRLGDGAALLVATGLAVEENGKLRRRALLVPHEDLLVATDDPKGHVGAEYVPEVAHSSARLASLTVRRPVERALDVGTGSGIQALLAARHAGHVVATDVSERALAYAAFNCALNGVENVELRRGSFFEPVDGETFGLVVANPPFAISPETDLLFRDSGLGRDRVSEQVVAGAAQALTDGGYASVNASWIVEGDAAARAREWIERAGCAGWVLHDEPLDAFASAVAWLGGDDAAALERWRAYYGQERIDRVAIGTLVLQRGGAVWSRSRVAQSTGAAGHHLERLFAGVALAAGEIAGLRLVPAPDVEIEQVVARSGPAWQVRHAALRLTGGLALTTTVDDAVLALLRSLDGRPVASLLAPVPPSERSGVTDVLAGLLELGFVVPA